MTLDRNLLPNAFAEIVALDHLASWDGAVKLLGFSRNQQQQQQQLSHRSALGPLALAPAVAVGGEDEIHLVLERCDMNLRQWQRTQQLGAEASGDSWPVQALQ